MKVSILCSGNRHPIYSSLVRWREKHAPMHLIELVESVEQLSGGDVLFLISYGRIIGTKVRSNYQKTLVIHASKLPEGRGWSPYIWQILEGRRVIYVTLLEAGDRVDSGAIWDQRTFELSGHELIDEIHEKLFAVELELMSFALANFDSVVPHPQDFSPATYYRRRTPEDSRLDPNQSLSSQFNLLRVCDSERYPAFFDLHGYRYKVTLSKMGRVER